MSVTSAVSRAYLVRHGTHALVGKVLAGRMPGVVLSPEGRAQAAQLADRFASNPVARVLSSPLERCRETAEAIAARLRLAVEVEPALNEIDCGEWTGRDFASLAGDPRWHAWNSQRDRNGIPGGEQVSEVRTRVMAVLAGLAARDLGPTVLVSHSDVIKVSVLTLLGAPFAHHDRVEIDPASVTTLDLWSDGGKVVRLNEAAS
jgi:broad specificity phosphatase PhoE